jgi:hypothetical protein
VQFAVDVVVEPEDEVVAKYLGICLAPMAPLEEKVR